MTSCGHDCSLQLYLIRMKTFRSSKILYTPCKIGFSSFYTRTNAKYNQPISDEPKPNPEDLRGSPWVPHPGSPRRLADREMYVIRRSNFQILGVKGLKKSKWLRLRVALFPSLVRRASEKKSARKINRRLAKTGSEGRQGRPKLRNVRFIVWEIYLYADYSQTCIKRSPLGNGQLTA